MSSEVLTTLVQFDEVLGISEGHRLVEAVPKSDSHEGSRGGVVPIDTGVDVKEQNLSLIVGDTLEEYPGGALAVIV